MSDKSEKPSVTTPPTVSKPSPRDAIDIMVETFDGKQFGKRFRQSLSDVGIKTDRDLANAQAKTVLVAFRAALNIDIQTMWAAARQALKERGEL